jgi:hypothetical protein
VVFLDNQPKAAYFAILQDVLLAMSASCCSHCGNSLDGDFLYCNKSCKKEARRRRRQKRDIDSELSQTVFINTMDPLAPAATIVPLSPENAVVGAASPILESLELLPAVKKRRRFIIDESDRGSLKHRAESNVVNLTASTMKHIMTSKNAFLDFCEEMDIDTDRLKELSQDGLSKLVLQYCQASLEDASQLKGKRPMYNVESFRDTYIPNLLRWFEMQNITVPADLKVKVKQKIRGMVKNKEVTKSQLPDQKGANPLTITDLEYILETTPIGIELYTELIAWLVLAVHSGQRGISMINFKWKHIQTFPGNQDGENDQLKITWERGKGQLSWNHTQMFEGSFGTKDNSPLFWLSQLWKLQQQNAESEMFGSEWENASKDIYVFQAGGSLSSTFRDTPEAEVYRRKLQRIATYCGYPPQFFSNHSTRSGCQISLYIRKRLASSNDEGIWDDIGLYIGYTPKSKNQMAYFRNNFRDLLALNTTLLDESGSKGRTAQKVLSQKRFETIHIFHNLPEAPKSRWKTQDKLELVRKLITASASSVAENIPPAQLQAMKDKFFHYATEKSEYSKGIQYFKNLVKKENEEVGKSTKTNTLEREAVARYLYGKAKRKWKEKQVPLWHTVKEKLEKEWVYKCFEDGLASYKPRGPMTKPRKKYAERTGVVRRSIRAANAGARMERIAKSGEERKKELEQIEKGKKEQEENMKTKKQTRVFWSIEETKILCKWVSDKGAVWSEICTKIPGRSNVHCKDRMRTLCNQMGISDWNMKDAAAKWLATNE